MREANDPTSPLRVGYVLKKFPRLSETFILNELLGLQEAGVELSVFSLRLPDEGRFHADVARLTAHVDYIPDFRSTSVWDAFRALPALGVEVGPALGRAVRFLERLPDAKRPSMLVQGVHLAERVRRHGIRHLHAHFMTIAAHAAYLAHLLTGVSFSVTAHAKDIYRNTVDREVFREMTEAAFRIVTVSDFNRRFIEEEILGHRSDRVIRIYNGLPLDEILEEARAEGTQDGDGPPRILGVGRLVEKKGFHLLLEACARLRDEGRHFECVLVGDGEEYERLVADRDRLGLRDRVRFAGACPRSDVLRTMRGSRVLAAPCVTGSDGNRDALPTVLLEALAVGLPVVATRLSGIPEIVDHGRDGLLVAEGDVDGLAAALRRILDDRALAAGFARAGSAKARDRFDRARTLPQLRGLFEEGARRTAPFVGERVS